MNTQVYEQKGYLNKDYRFFHISDQEKIDIPFHYHDFDKLILILGGNVKYIIEMKKSNIMVYIMSCALILSVNLPDHEGSMPCTS